MTPTLGQPIPFSEVRTFFEDECEYGQLCDIVVPESTTAAWKALLELIASKYSYRFRWFTEGDEDPPSVPLPIEPDRLTTLEQSEDGPWPDLTFDLAGLRARVFFTFSHIEVDVWRVEVDERRYIALCEFVRTLGQSGGCDVFLTPESDLDRAEIVYVAASDRFRRLGGGAESDPAVRSAFLSELNGALKPLLSVPFEPGLDVPQLPLRLLSQACSDVEALLAQGTELQRHDDLPLDLRQLGHHAWVLLATLVTPPSGVFYSNRMKASYEQELRNVATRVRQAK